MMKKMFVLLTSALTIFLLAACQQKTETGTDFLEGIGMVQNGR